MSGNTETPRKGGLSGEAAGDALADAGRKLTVNGLVPLVDLSEISIPSAEETGAAISKLQDTGARVAEWVRVHLAKLEGFRTLPGKLPQKVAQERSQIEVRINAYLTHGEPVIRSAACLAVFSFRLSQQNLLSQEEVETVLGELVQQGLLREDPAGDLEAYKKRYAVVEPALDGSDIATIKLLLEGLLRKVYQEVGRVRAERSKALQQQASITLEQLLQGQPGDCALRVPTEMKEVVGGERWFGGGTLFVRSDGKRIYPVAATGSFEDAIEEAARRNLFLLLDSLKWDRPPFIKELSADEGKKVQLLWHLMQRAIKADAQRKQFQGIRDGMAEQATVSAEEFFLKRKTGTTLADFRGTWRSPGGTFQNLFFLVSRGEKDGVPTIQLVEIPEHLEEFFANCGEEYPEGENYEGVPQPLQRVLRAIAGRINKASQIAENDQNGQPNE